MKIVGKAGAAIKQPAKKLTTAAAAARFVRLFRSPPCPFQPHLEERRKSGENNVCKNERMKEAGKAERQWWTKQASKEEKSGPKWLDDVVAVAKALRGGGRRW